MAEAATSNQATFAERLRVAMDLRGVSAEGLSRATGGLVSAGSIYAWLRGERTIRHDNLVLVCRALSVSSDFLLGLTDDPAPRPTEESRYSDRLAAAVAQLPRMKMLPGTLRISDWVPCPEHDARMVAEAPGLSPVAKIINLADAWHAAGLTHHDSSRVASNPGIIEVVSHEATLHGGPLREGEARWLACNCETTRGAQISREFLERELAALRALV